MHRFLESNNPIKKPRSTFLNFLDERIQNDTSKQNIFLYLSRGKERLKIQDFKGALEDFNHVLTLEKDNQIANEGKEECLECLKQVKNHSYLSLYLP